MNTNETTFDQGPKGIQGNNYRSPSAINNEQNPFRKVSNKRPLHLNDSIDTMETKYRKIQNIDYKTLHKKLNLKNKQHELHLKPQRELR